MLTYQQTACFAELLEYWKRKCKQLRNREWLNKSRYDGEYMHHLGLDHVVNVLDLLARRSRAGVVLHVPGLLSPWQPFSVPPSRRLGIKSSQSQSVCRQCCCKSRVVP